MNIPFKWRVRIGIFVATEIIGFIFLFAGWSMETAGDGTVAAILAMFVEAAAIPAWRDAAKSGRRYGKKLMAEDPRYRDPLVIKQMEQRKKRRQRRLRWLRGEYEHEK